MVFQYAGGYPLHEDVPLAEWRETGLVPYHHHTHFSPYIHCYSTDFGPAVPLDLVLVVGCPSLQERFVYSPSTSNHTHHCSVS